VAHILLLQDETSLLEPAIMLIILNRAAFVPARSFHKLCCCVLVAVSFVMVSIPAAAIDLRSATVQDINRAFDAGTLTSEELVRRYLARIEARRPIAVLWV
jgi:hypothetical protein